MPEKAAVIIAVPENKPVVAEPAANVDPEKEPAIDAVPEN